MNISSVSYKLNPNITITLRETFPIFGFHSNHIKMKSLIDGHYYELDHSEGDGKEEISFIWKEPIEGDKEGKLVKMADGTTNEEVLLMLIDRIEYLDKQVPSPENKEVIIRLKECINILNKRTQDRYYRRVDNTYRK